MEVVATLARQIGFMCISYIAMTAKTKRQISENFRYATTNMMNVSTTSLLCVGGTMLTVLNIICPKHPKVKFGRRAFDVIKNLIILVHAQKGKKISEAVLGRVFS